VIASFSSTVVSWQNFYILAGTASATLVGLIFVAVSLHLDLIGESGAGATLTLARRTFSRFILVVIVSLLFQVPSDDPRGLGLPLLAIGVADGVRTLRAGRVMRREVRGGAISRDVVNRFVFPVVLPLLSSGGLIAVAATVLAGKTEYLYWMVPIIALILANAASNAWDLMLGLARYRARRANSDVEGPA
jgi:hypothetical protein